MNGFLGFLIGFILGIIIISVPMDDYIKEAYKQGQVDAIHSKWQYTALKDKDGNEYIVKIEEKK
jgi:hypothetical protein